MPDLIELRPAALSGKLPIKLNTAYRWHHIEKHPGLIVKILGKLFWNETEWQEIVKKEVDTQTQMARKKKKFS